jgi:hypothetical protein
MVETARVRHDTFYLCELCGFGYDDLITAEKCEQYCDIHGNYSRKITGQAILKPNVDAIQVTA